MTIISCHKLVKKPTENLREIVVKVKYAFWNDEKKFSTLEAQGNEQLYLFGGPLLNLGFKVRP